MEAEAEEITQAIEKAISQPGKHACQSDPGSRCRATPASSRDLIFIDNKKYPHCPYYTILDDNGFCLFAPRKELYRKYKV